MSAPLMSDVIMLSPLLWTLVVVQLAMGGFDIVFHHEMTERLAWKDNAAHELRLHAWRNLFYAFLFLSFAWAQPQGWLAIALIAVLAAEIVITLWDFVEEDMTRKLPPTERVLHTLLAINYGAILALIAPAIVAWIWQPTAIVWINYGWGSAVLTLAALGVFVFALRDFHTSHRARFLLSRRPIDLSDILAQRASVLVTGGTGFVGSELVRGLAASGCDITVLTRNLANTAHLATPVRLITGLDQIDDNAHFDAIIDLAGEPVAGGLWTWSRRYNIIASRVRTARALRSLVWRLATKPSVYIKASAVGVYGPRDNDGALGEAAELGPRQVFSARSCQICEAEADRMTGLGIRVVNLRIGLVLGRDGGLLSRMLPPFDLGLGGPIGSGQQWMSWITRDDLVRLITFAVVTPSIRGPLNATAPKPVQNSEFARLLGRVLGRPAFLPLPAWPLAMVLGDFAQELLLTGQQVIPDQALAKGFRFRHPTLDRALEDELPFATGKARKRGQSINLETTAEAR
ncbi:MAG: TIGR01777 family oxidoreductase [Pseudomonadota bacterium]